MTSIAVNVPVNYGYVVLSSGVLSFFTFFYMGGQVMQARKKYNVPLPNLYATPGHHDHADEFNSIQRGHQNHIETYPSFLVFALLGGLKHPLLTTVGSLLYNIGCVRYQVGYTANPKSRNSKGGLLKWIGMLINMGSTISFAGSLLGWF